MIRGSKKIFIDFFLVIFITIVILYNLLIISVKVLFNTRVYYLKAAIANLLLQMYIGLIGPRPTQMTKSANKILQCYYMMQRKSEYRDPSRTTVRMLDSLVR